MKKHYSKKRVSRAGKELVSDNKENFDEAFDVLSYWRSRHEIALENALALLRETTLKRDKDAFFSKRLKRYPSIVGKLKRFPEMELKNMQDIGGCRAIVASQKKVIQIARDIKSMPRFKRDGSIRFKDYIKSPKEDGYRGYHIVGKFDDGYGERKNIEIQIRSKLQHSWATTVEIVDLFTGQDLKSSKGSIEWSLFFKEASRQFSIMEESVRFHVLDEKDKLEEYGKQLLVNNDSKEMRINSCITVKEKAKSLLVPDKLDAYANSLRMVDEWLDEDSPEGYVLLQVDINKREVRGEFFVKEDFNLAKKQYAEYEKATTDNDEQVVALVSSDSVGGVKKAYPNYFADSTDFLRHLALVLKAPVIPDGGGFFSAISNWIERSSKR